jgi:hypothetical protein
MAALAALALLANGCGSRGGDAPQGSVTVKLPPARPATSSPGFGFQEAKRRR